MSTTDVITFKYEPKQELTLTAGRCMCLITLCSGLNQQQMHQQTQSTRGKCLC